MNRRLVLVAPLVVAAGAGLGFLAMLRGMQSGRFDPRSVGHPLVGRAVPPFTLAGVDGGAGFSDADLRGGTPTLLNFFASWCQPCVEEAPILAELPQVLPDAGRRLFGIAYKDKPLATQAFLGRHGNPYQRLAADGPGQVAIDFGVTGVPETFLVDGHGIVRWHYAGPMTERVVAELAPLFRAA